MNENEIVALKRGYFFSIRTVDNGYITALRAPGAYNDGLYKQVHNCLYSAILRYYKLIFACAESKAKVIEVAHEIEGIRNISVIHMMEDRIRDIEDELIAKEA